MYVVLLFPTWVRGVQMCSKCSLVVGVVIMVSDCGGHIYYNNTLAVVMVVTAVQK